MLSITDRMYASRRFSDDVRLRHFVWSLVTCAMILAPGCASTSTKALFRTQLLERGSVEATGDALVQAQDAFTAGQFQEAERQYEIYVAQEPTDIARWQRLADFYRRIGMRDRMRLAIEVALDLLSDDQVADPALQQWKQCVQAALNGDAEVGDC